jgi:serine protease Do
MNRIAFFLILCFLSAPVLAKKTIQKLYESVDGSVVELHVKSLPGAVAGGGPVVSTKTSGSLGSGVVINDKGRILTAAHVIEKATKIEINFADGTKTTGHVVWVNNFVDLAMIQAAELPKNIKPAKLANAGEYNIGEQLIVIGAPLGVSHSLSVGYLSGVRDKEPLPVSKMIPRFLQTDAAINMGNSGGPMFNLDGEVIGIVSHILSKSGGSNGIGFAVSVDTIHDVINSSPGHFSGFIPFILNEELSTALNNPHGYGLLIQQVIPNSLADKLGFKGGTLNVTIGHLPILLGGDIVLGIDGFLIKGIEGAIKAQQHLSTVVKGQQVIFTFLRNGHEEKVSWIVD